MTEAHEGLKTRPIYRRYWVMPHPSQLADDEAEEETEEEQVPALALSSRDKVLKRTLMDLSSALMKMNISGILYMKVPKCGGEKIFQRKLQKDWILSWKPSKKWDSRDIFLLSGTSWWQPGKWVF